MHDNYGLVPLKSLANLRMGGTPSRNEPSYWAHEQAGAPWVSISDIRKKFIEKTAETVTDEGRRAARLKYVEPGTPIMSFKLSLGKVTIPRIPVLTNEAIVALEAVKGRADSRWLYHAVPRVAARAVSEVAVKGNTLNLDKLRKLLIPTPESIAEQCRIAEVLDDIDEQIHAVNLGLDKVSAIAQGVDSDLLGWNSGIDPRNGWSLTPLEQVAEGTPICYGIVQAGPYDPDGVPVVMIRDLAGDFVSLSRTSPSIDASYSRSRITAGDVLLSIKATIGRVAVVPEGFHGNISRDLARIRVSPEHDPRFLKWLLGTQSIKRRLQDSVVGSTRAEVSISVLKKIRVPMPNKAEQLKILEVVQANHARLESLDSELTKLRTLKQGLMDDLLTGRVRMPVGFGS